MIGMFVQCIFINLLVGHLTCSYTGSLTVVLIKHLLDIPVSNPKGGDKTLWYIIGSASGFVLVAVLVGLLYMKRSSSRGDGSRTVSSCHNMHLVHVADPENGNITWQMNAGVKKI